MNVTPTHPGMREPHDPQVERAVATITTMTPGQQRAFLRSVFRDVYAYRASGNPDTLVELVNGVIATVVLHANPTYRAAAAQLDTTPARRVRVRGGLYHGRIPPGAVYVGRTAPGLPGSRYANPHRIATTCPTCPGVRHDRPGAITAYTRDLTARPDLIPALRNDLAGRDLACWCPPHLPCHADVLLAVAAGADPTTPPPP